MYRIGLISFLCLASTACAANKRTIFIADIDEVSSSRAKLERNVTSDNRDSFFFLDRDGSNLYSLHRIEGFSFRRIDPEKLRRERPEIFHQLECSTGTICSTEEVNDCKEVFALRGQAHPSIATKTRLLLKAKGYPVVAVFFIRDNIEYDKLEIRYFTECDKIETDFFENFPDMGLR